jgi:hypothetical protein
MGGEVVGDAVGVRVGRWEGALDGEIVGDGEVGSTDGDMDPLVAVTADDIAHTAATTVINGTICFKILCMHETKRHRPRDPPRRLLLIFCVWATYFEATKKAVIHGPKAVLAVLVSCCYSKLLYIQ